MGSTVTVHRYQGTTPLRSEYVPVGPNSNDRMAYLTGNLIADPFVRPSD